MGGRPILTAAEMRAAEERAIAAGTSVDTLMDRAGRGIADEAFRFAGHVAALVLCGPGNNGGDGYVAARVLREQGVSVRVAALADPRTPAAIAARRAWDGPVEPLAGAAPAPLVIDALFGTGLTRGLDPDVAAELNRLVGEAHYGVAVDLPSGVATDDGCVLSPVPRFDLTVPLGALKPSHLLQPAARFMGRLATVEIGLGALPATLCTVDHPRIAAPGPDDHKYSRGMVTVIGGAMPGAVLLAASAAQRAGAGYVVLSGSAQGGPLALVRRELDEALADPRTGALVLGPGLGLDGAAQAIFEAALSSARPLVIDADALTLLGRAGLDCLVSLPAMPILTPHEGEFARLFGDISGSKIERAREAARRANAVVLLKGADSVVAHPDGRAAIAPPASPWLASAGTGDVLSGIIAARIAAGLDPYEAACQALWLHAEAARLAGPVLIADDLIAHLPAAVAACL